MTLLHDAVEFKKLDVRLMERNVARGVVSAGDVAKAIKELPDDSESAEYVNVNELVLDPNE